MDSQIVIPIVVVALVIIVAVCALIILNASEIRRGKASATDDEGAKPREGADSASGFTPDAASPSARDTSYDARSRKGEPPRETTAPPSGVKMGRKTATSASPASNTRKKDRLETVTFLEYQDAFDKWICPVCGAEMPLGTPVCVVCEFAKR